jgi:RNA polymerase sigma-70 factor (ECF subfamily)
VSTHRSDNELLAQMQAGSTLAFGELYARYRHPAYRVACKVCPDRARAEEAVQEAFSSIWKSRATYRPVQPTAGSWLLRVVHHRAIDIARRDASYDAHRASDVALEGHAAPHDVAAEMLERDAAFRLRARLARLPDVQRQAIELAFHEALSHTEIAELLGLPVGTVKARIRRGLHTLHDDIQDDESQS